MLKLAERLCYVAWFPNWQRSVSQAYEASKPADEIIYPGWKRGSLMLAKTPIVVVSRTSRYSKYQLWGISFLTIPYLLCYYIIGVIIWLHVYIIFLLLFYKYWKHYSIIYILSFHVWTLFLLNFILLLLNLSIVILYMIILWQSRWAAHEKRTRNSLC